MTTEFDTTPTAEDLAAARTKLAALVAQRSPTGGAETTATIVAIELGVVLARLKAADELDARFVAEARALFDEWMRL